jgi:glutamyl-tRNA synthetase
LEKEKEAARKEGRAYRYSGRCRNAKYLSGALRFKVKGGKVRFKDLIRGEIEEDSSLWGDFLIVRADGRPLFYFSNLIDDAEMKISHVIRGDDHISNTFRQIVIQQALNFPQPIYAHLPMLVNADRSKISKRRNPVSVTYDFLAKGFLPEALVNYLALLGWAPSNNREIFSLEELISEFDISRVQKSSAAWDQRKLEFLNGYYIAHLEDEDLAERLAPFLESLSKKKLRKLAPLLKGRIKTLLEAKELSSFAVNPTKPKKELIPAKGSDRKTAKKALEAAISLLRDYQNQSFNIKNFEDRLNNFISQNSLKRGDVLWPLRYSLTGSLYSPGAFEVLDYLGPKEALKRLEEALKILD